MARSWHQDARYGLQAEVRCTEADLRVTGVQVLRGACELRGEDGFLTVWSLWSGQTLTYKAHTPVTPLQPGDCTAMWCEVEEIVPRIQSQLQHRLGGVSQRPT